MRYELSSVDSDVGRDLAASQNEAPSTPGQHALPEGVSHNLACLNTLWMLGFFDDALYEQTKKVLPDAPDFEQEGEQTAIGGPGALLQWMIDKDLLGRAQFEALAARFVREGVERKRNEKDDLHRIVVAMAVDSEFCARVFNAAMSRKKARAYGPYVVAAVILILMFLLR